MLELIIPKREDFWVEKTQEFISFPEVKLRLEHSLISLGKWEQHYKKPFLSTELKGDEFVYYVKCMSIAPISNETLAAIFVSKEALTKIQEYISDPMTATTFNRENLEKMKTPNGRHDIITAEVIYYWMSELNLPFDVCEKWHLNRLLALIEVCNLKKSPSKSMSKQDVYKQNASLNKMRRAAKGSKG